MIYISNKKHDFLQVTKASRDEQEKTRNQQYFIINQLELMSP